MKYYLYEKDNSMAIHLYLESFFLGHKMITNFDENLQVRGERLTGKWAVETQLYLSFNIGLRGDLTGVYNVFLFYRLRGFSALKIAKKNGKKTRTNTSANNRWTNKTSNRARCAGKASARQMLWDIASPVTVLHAWRKNFALGLFVNSWA